MTSSPEQTPLITRANVRRELARRSLLHFIRQTKADFIEGHFNQRLAAILDQFYLDVQAGLNPRVIVEAPPRHGKTQLISRHGPAHWLGRDPSLEILACSYAAGLAHEMGRDVQTIMDADDYRDIFPETVLYRPGRSMESTALRNAEGFRLVGQTGAYRCAGVGGGIAGKGADILIVDDPIKDAKEAMSPTVREAIWNWFNSTAYTRLSPKGGVIILMTRWDEDDLAGKLQKAAKEEGGEQWVVHKFPAIAEEPDEFRDKGEALFPARYPIHKLMRLKARLGSRWFEALYQQNPSAAEGTILKRAYWQRYVLPEDPEARKQAMELLGIWRVVQSWDTAFKDGEENDQSACVTVGVGRRGYYLLDAWKGRVEFPELKAKVRDLGAAWGPQIILVEDKASGQSLIQELQRDSLIPVVPITVDRDKVARAHAITPILQAELVAVPEGYEWVHPFIESCAKFPNAAHDADIVDALTQALNYLANGGGDLGLFEYYLSEVEEKKRIEAQAKEGSNANP